MLLEFNDAYIGISVLKQLIPVIELALQQELEVGGRSIYWELTTLLTMRSLLLQKCNALR